MLRWAGDRVLDDEALLRAAALSSRHPLAPARADAALTLEPLSTLRRDAGRTHGEPLALGHRE